MTATSEYIQGTPQDLTAHDRLPAKTVDGSRALVRGSQSLLGAALMLSAAGLWVAPGSDLSADVLLTKLVISLVIGFCGLALVQQGRAPASPEVEIDTVRREVRVVRRAGEGDTVISRTKFADLAGADLDGGHVTLWAANDVMLAEVALTDPAVRRTLLAGLSDAGKL